MPRMKFPLCQLELQDVNVTGQGVIDPSPQYFCGDRRNDVEMRHLFERMHARVRSPRAVQLEPILAGDLPDDPGELTLNGPRVFLDLPAAVLRAGVFDRGFESGHLAAQCTFTSGAGPSRIGGALCTQTRSRAAYKSS